MADVNNRKGMKMPQAAIKNKFIHSNMLVCGFYAIFKHVYSDSLRNFKVLKVKMVSLNTILHRKILYITSLFKGLYSLACQKNTLFCEVF